MNSVLIDAHNLINGQRMKAYGKAGPLFKDLAGMFTEYTGKTITPADAVVFMVLLKLVRLRNSGYQHRDSLLDAAGYIGLLEQLMPYRSE